MEQSCVATGNSASKQSLGVPPQGREHKEVIHVTVGAVLFSHCLISVQRALNPAVFSSNIKATVRA